MVREITVKVRYIIPDDEPGLDLTPADKVEKMTTEELEPIFVLDEEFFSDMEVSVKDNYNIIAKS